MKLFLPLCVITLFTAVASATPPITTLTSPVKIESAKHADLHSIIVKKTKTSKNHKVELYPDADQKALFFNVRGLSGKVYQLFVFDMDGKIVKQAEIRNKQTTLIKDIEVGTYLFEVFSNDDRIGEGQIAVQ